MIYRMAVSQCMWTTRISLAICRPSGCTVASGVVCVVVVVVGICNRSQMKTSKCVHV